MKTTAGFPGDGSTGYAWTPGTIRKVAVHSMAEEPHSLLEWWHCPLVERDTH